jgi:hypothetical protein
VFQKGADGPVCNTNPMLTATEASTMKNTPVTVTIPYSDEDGDLPATPGIVNNLDPSEGSIVPASWMGNATGVSFSFVPAPGFVGIATFDVAVLDARNALSNVAPVFVTVTNKEPVFNAGGEVPGSPLDVEVVRGGSVDIPLPFSDGDGDVMLFEHVAGAGPNNGTVTPASLPSGTGGPTVTYQHNGTGDTDMFSVQADDQSGGMTVGQVNIFIVDALFEIIAADMSEDHVVTVTPCPTPLGQIVLRNHSDQPASYSMGAGSPLISFGMPGPPYVQQSFGGTIPAGEERVVDVYFNCGAATDVNTTITVQLGNGQGSVNAMVNAMVDVEFPTEKPE